MRLTRVRFGLVATMMVLGGCPYRPLDLPSPCAVDLGAANPRPGAMPPAQDFAAPPDLCSAADLATTPRNDLALAPSNDMAGAFKADMAKRCSEELLLPSVPMPSGAGNTIARGDFDGDGKLDLVSASDFSAVVLRGNGDGTFQPPQSVQNISSVASTLPADVNGDGKLDLVFAGGVSYTIVLGNGDGTFRSSKITNLSIPDSRSIAAATTGDFDGDGKLDLAVVANNVYVLLGNGDGSFKAPGRYATAPSAATLMSGDLDNDGEIDLVTTSIGNNVPLVSVLLGNGDGTFQSFVGYGTGPGSSAAAIADFNRDGSLDVVAGTSILLGNGDGTLRAPVRIPGSGNAITVGDFDGDGNLDLAGTQSDSDAAIVLGKGDGTFANAVAVNASDGTTTIVAGDFDGNGTLDLAASNVSSGIIRVVLGNGDASFRVPQLILGGEPNAIASADFDGDGKLDLAVVADKVYVLLGNGDGSFKPALTSPGSAYAGASRLAVGDFDGNGKPDLVLVGSKVTVLLNHGDGSFASPISYAVSATPVAVTVADFDGDGKPDLAVACSYSISNSVDVLFGNGDGSFKPAVAHPVEESATVVAGDFNGDGKLDFATGGDEGVWMFLGNGDGSFKPPFLGTDEKPYIRPIATVDVNGDGKLDLIMAYNFFADLAVLLGKGDGTFAWSAVYWAASNDNEIGAIRSGDVNSDGKIDLVTANENDGDIGILLGSGDGSFNRLTLHFAAGRNPSDVTLGDFNGDGRLDLACSSSNGVILLINNSQCR
jgi:hypothetical protein